MCLLCETRGRKAPEGEYNKHVVWLARPSHLIAGALRAGRDGLAEVTIRSHLFDQSDATGRNSC